MIPNNSSRHRPPKRNLRKEREMYDVFGLSTSLELIQSLVEVDGFVDILLESTDTFLSTSSNGLDIVLDFISNFLSSFAGSFDDLINTSNLPYSIGNLSEL